MAFTRPMKPPSGPAASRLPIWLQWWEKTSPCRLRFPEIYRPFFVVRDPLLSGRFPLFETPPRPLYDWGAWPHSAQRELETACEHLRRSEIRIEELSRWAAKLEAESRQRTEWALSLQHDCDERTNWARRLETELAVAGKHVRRLEAESAERAVWALGIEAELQERTAWALRMEADLNAMDARREELEAELAERTAWALQLNRELEETRARVPTGCAKSDPEISATAPARLAIHFAEHNVERADNGDHIGHQRTDSHLLQRLQVDERRRADADAVGVKRAVADHEVAEFALGRFDRDIGFARRGL